MLDAFLSLPLLSFLAIPALSSYGTSLNLLFFSFTWATIVLSYHYLQVEILTTLFVRTTCFLLPALAFLLFDCAAPSVAVMMKAYGEPALPGRRGSRRLVRIACVALANVALELALQAGVELLSVRLFRKSAIMVTMRLPMPLRMVKHLAYGLVIRGILQFYLHRYLLHSSSRHQLTAWHTSWQHSIPLPFSIAAAYDHPIAHIIHWWLPLYLPAFLFRMHVLTFQLLVAIASLEQLLTYSGYSTLPSTIMLNGMARRLEAHMTTEGEGNYAAFGALDWFHGTSLGGDVMDDLAAEMDKRDVEGKAEGAADNAKEKMKVVGKQKGKGKK